MKTISSESFPPLVFADSPSSYSIPVDEDSGSRFVFEEQEQYWVSS
jgi:hypothetical protein